MANNNPTNKIGDYDDVLFRLHKCKSERSKHQRILDELQNLHKELKEIKAELSFIKNSLGNHFLIQGKWIHIDHFVQLYLPKRR